MFVASTRNVDRNPVTRAAALRVAAFSRTRVALPPPATDGRDAAKQAAPDGAVSEAPAETPAVAERRKDPTVEVRRRELRSARLFGSYNPTGAYTLKLIADRVCRFHGVSLDELRGVSRKRRFVLARQCFCYWARQLTEAHYPHIGRFLDCDHTTVLHGERVYRERASRARARRREGRRLAAQAGAP